MSESSRLPPSEWLREVESVHASLRHRNRTKSKLTHEELVERKTLLRQQLHEILEEESANA